MWSDAGCAGLEAGCEAAIHATRQMYQDGEGEALLVDAKNAFNSLNRRVALHNVGRICPVFYPFLVNCYRKPTKLHVSGCDEVMWSEEGTTQGDPCGMAMYAGGSSDRRRGKASKGKGNGGEREGCKTGMVRG